MNISGWKRIFIIMIVISISGMGISENFFIVVSSQYNLADSPTIFIDSRFKLWDNTEKILDANFNITIIYINNYTDYNIIVYLNDKQYNYTGSYYFTQNYSIIDTDIIYRFEILINNITYFKESGIILTSGITASRIQNIGEPFTINLNPSEWNKKEWNIFYALIFSSLIGIIISYKLVKRFRIKSGVKTIQ